MKQAIKILEDRVKALKYMIGLEKQEKDAGAVFTLTSPDIDVRLSEAEYILGKLKEEYDKKRSEQRASRHSKLSSGKVS